MTEAAAFTPSFYHANFNPAYRQPLPDRAPDWQSAKKTEKKPDTQSSLTEYVSYFDQNWQKEGLPHDWHNLRGKKSEVGFSMKLQLSLIQDTGDPRDMEKFVQKTKKDLLGFKLEYLSDHLVYPCKYNIDQKSYRLESLEYGGNDITETVSEKERGGSVKKSLEKMKSFFLSDAAPEGSIAVMASPLGDSGLATDNGNKILYPDSYFFIMQKNGDTITNYTVKTDFTHRQTREVIFALTGKNLAPDAPLEEYVQSVATLKPDEKKGIKSIGDVIKILEEAKPEHAYKNPITQEKTNWKSVYEDISNASALYDFNDQTAKIITDFEDYCRGTGLTKNDLQKAMAATILRLSQLFYIDEAKAKKPVTMHPRAWTVPVSVDTQSFGSILNAVSERPGCAGGGSLAVSSITERSGVAGSDRYGSREFSCPTCKILNIRPFNKMLSKCQHCGSRAVAC